MTLWTRKGETIDRVRTDARAGYVCYTHRDVPAVEVDAHWDDSGTRLTRWAHADGTQCDNGAGNGYPLFPYRTPVCRHCGHVGEDHATHTMEAYGNRIDYACGAREWQTIGD